jgi:hypothetical protein
MKTIRDTDRALVATMAATIAAPYLTSALQDCIASDEDPTHAPEVTAKLSVLMAIEIIQEVDRRTLGVNARVGGEKRSK